MVAPTSDRVDVAELLDLCWDIPADQDKAFRFMVQGGLEGNYLRLRERVAKVGAFAALMEIWEKFTYDAEFHVWFALAARAERELQQAATNN